MSYKPISLSNLILARRKDLFLPHIQRPFVWSVEQVTRLMDSLMRNYPIQTFLFWKTTDHIKVRRFMDGITDDEVSLSEYYDPRASEQGVPKTLVLDGQQRLQTLFSVFDGQVNGKDFYIDITSGNTELETGLFYDFKLMDSPPDARFVLCKGLVHDRRNAEDIADELNDKLMHVFSGAEVEEQRNREKLVRKNVAQLISLIREDKHFWHDELDGIAQKYSYSQILDIFIRINSGGTKLDAADLMFSAMKEAWEGIEENIETTVENLNSGLNLGFDKTFILKGLMLISGKGAILSPELFQGEKGEQNLAAAEANWDAASDAFMRLRDFIQQELKIYSPRVIRSYNAFLPVFEYMFYNPKAGSTHYQELKSYFYRSQLFNWFSARTDAVLNGLHNVLKDKTGFPLMEIRDYFLRMNKVVDFKQEHLDEKALRFLVLNLVYVEKHGTSPFNVAYRGNEPHIDHIYPKSKLKDRPSNKVNHIFNFRFVGGTDNIKKRAELPDSYFTRLKANGFDISKHLMVKDYSDNPQTMTLDNFDDFWTRRGQEINTLCERVINR